MGKTGQGKGSGRTLVRNAGNLTDTAAVHRATLLLYMPVSADRPATHAGAQHVEDEQ